MTAADIQLLIDYHYWARDRVLEAVAEIAPEEFTAARGSSFSSIRDTLAHTYFAEWAWHQRWLGHSPSAMPDLTRFADVSSLRAAWLALEQQVRSFLAPLDDTGVTRVIDYRLFSGATGSTPIWQMVQHLVNHASYHRGQVTTMLRQSGAKPAKGMDLIHFYRERAS
jgi:uncharacterized damage-inducible protein DinB